MRNLHNALGALALVLAATIPIGANSATPGSYALAALVSTDWPSRFNITDSTSADTATGYTTIGGTVIPPGGCAGTLEVKCSSGGNWQAPPSGNLTCGHEDNLLYREKELGKLTEQHNLVERFTCDSFDAPEGQYVFKQTQNVTISGTLSLCGNTALTAQSSCTYEYRRVGGRDPS